mmetsp:Transcript_54315/g.118835  ORF Transcript_54315/g.118835 Transcript_54315/m.118835 type:complete len:669 (+) Transcript_54315:121-2127(+)
MAQQLKDIVDRLNAEPFSCDLSLVSFDEKEPLELMELLKKVLVYLDPKHEVDLREEKPDAMYQRIAEFLHILGYQCSFDIEFQTGLINGEKQTVHPILYWLLNNLEQLKKRSYLAKFCVNLEVPEEFLREEKVYEVHKQYKELQSQFKATHAHLEEERRSRANPTDLEREVSQLSSEKDQLAQKITELKHKSERDQGFQALLKVTSDLRKEQEQEAMLVEKLAEQRYQLEQTEQLYIEKSAKLREMREAARADGEGDAEAMLRMLRKEVIKGREQLDRIRRENEEKLQRLKEIDMALSDPPVTKSDINQLEDELQTMQMEVQSLERKINEHNQDSRLSVYKQQANLVAKKKEAVLKDKKQLEDERDTLSKELSQKEREFEQTKGHKHMNKEEFKNYAQSLREKSSTFKKLKAELSELRAQVAELTRQEQDLQAKDPTPEGMREAEEALEKVSVEKSHVDKEKGKTLGEISSTVEEINAILQDKRIEIAPQIRQWRAVRQNMQQIEAKYMEKKAVYDQAKGAMDSELSKLVADVRQLENEVVEAQQSYHEQNIHLTTLDGKLVRAQHEARCRRGEESFSPEFSTLEQKYAKYIEELDEQCKELRKEQKEVKETHEDVVKQKMAFVQLEKLMQLKLQVTKQEALNAQYSGGIPSRAIMESAGVERLVIDS